MSHAMGPSAGHTEKPAEKSALSVRSVSGEAQTPDQIEAEIEVQRAQLAETIDALSAKLDVKSQAQAKVEEAKHTAQAKVAQVKQAAQSTAGTVTSAGRPRPELLAFGITVLLATAVLWWRER